MEPALIVVVLFEFDQDCAALGDQGIAHEEHLAHHHAHCPRQRIHGKVLILDRHVIVAFADLVKLAELRPYVAPIWQDTT